MSPRNNVYEQIGHNLRKIRQQMGFMQIDVAAAANLNRTYISRIENGKARITLSLLKRLVSGLEISSNELFAEDQNEASN
ncbi:MAG: helix-turn-helix transcriptional regulator [Oligoflexia bacterium]|nr:helix-turn-helix transcriptional regulator [Oligoflexia bacterium]